jgi:4'-phosphopantetheinyl transferase
MKFWQTAPLTLQLQPAQVHVWRADLRVCRSHLPLMQQLLSADERARAERFRFEKDQQRFTLARGILRSILSRYLNCAAASLQFHYSEMGKPMLAQPLCFNLSHSAEIALYAVAWDRQVGIDVEEINPNRDWEGVAARFFSAQEQAELAQLNPEQKLQGFFNGWTRKEALLKAIGKGLTIPLYQFAVSLSPAEPARLLSVDWDTSQLHRWAIVELPVGTDYAAAVAAAVTETEPKWQLQGWQFGL